MTSRGVPVEARADTGLPPDAAPDVLPGGLAGPALQPLGVDEPARAPVPYHQKVQPQPSGGSNAARRSSSPASSHGHRSSLSKTPNGGALDNILPVPTAAYLPQTSAPPSSTRARPLRCTSRPSRSSIPPTLQAARMSSPPAASPSRPRNVQTVLAARASAKLAAAYSAASRSAPHRSRRGGGRSGVAPKSSERGSGAAPCGRRARAVPGLPHRPGRRWQGLPAPVPGSPRPRCRGPRSRRLSSGPRGLLPFAGTGGERPSAEGVGVTRAARRGVVRSSSSMRPSSAAARAPDSQSLPTPASFREGRREPISGRSRSILFASSRAAAPRFSDLVPATRSRPRVGAERRSGATCDVETAAHPNPSGEAAA